MVVSPSEEVFAVEINYIDYSQDLLQQAISDEEPLVYVFDNQNTRKRAQQYCQRPFLERESLFLTLEELKERLFPPQRLMLKEEKRAVLLFELLTAEEKNDLGISNYFDFIDFSSRFFDFLELWQEYCLEEVEGLRAWQQERHQLFSRLSWKYRHRIKELGFSDQSLDLNDHNFNSLLFEEYQGLVLVNILYFTPREQNFLKRLEEEGKEITLFLQLFQGDFDEEQLQLEKITLPEKLPVEVELYHTEEPMLQLINLLVLMEEEEQSPFILDADLSESNYRQLLSPQQVSFNREYSFQETPYYHFLEALYNLLSSSYWREEELIVGLKEMMAACYQEGFRSYYSLAEGLMTALKELADRDYLYFTPQLLDKEGPSLGALFHDLEKMSSLNSLSDYCLFLQQLDWQRLNCGQYHDQAEKLYDGLAELGTLAELGIVSSWDRYFIHPPTGLLLFILRYLQFKRVQMVNEGQEPAARMEDLLSAAHTPGQWTIMLNVSQGMIPSESGEGSLFTEKQRQELGLFTASQKILQEKYLFFRHLLNSSRVTIFSLRNREQNTTISSFVEELRLKYGLSLNRAPVEGSDLIQAVPSLLSTARSPSLSPMSGDEKLMPLQEGDIPSTGLRLGYYKYQILSSCPYSFYLQYIAGLEGERMVPLEGLSPRVLGIMVHSFFEENIKRGGWDLFQRPEKFQDNGLLEEMVAEIIDANRLRISQDYIKYYHKLLMPRVIESLLYFIERMQYRLGRDDYSLTTEWSPPFGGKNITDGQVLLRLTGRIDLVLESENRLFLVDFKTGSSDGEQLDFYSLLYDPPPERELDKLFYHVFKEKIEGKSSGSEQDLATSLVENMEELINLGYYECRPHSGCRYCDYQDLCQEVNKSD